MAYIPTQNTSVSGTVGASIVGLPYFGVAGSVATVGTAVANQSVSGRVEVTQVTNPWIVTGSVQTTVTPAANQSVSGTVITNQGTSPWIVTGSVQGSFTPAANQSVSGTVQAQLQSTNASVITVGGSTGNSSVQVLNFPSNQSISGTINVGTLPLTSVRAVQQGDWIISGSVQTVGTAVVNQSVSGTVITNQGTNPWLITGSVQASLTPAANQSVSGTVQAQLLSTNASVITVGGSTGNSSVQVINFPTNQSVSGTVGATQIGTWGASVTGTVFVAGSVATVGTAVANQSVSGTVNIGTLPLTSVRAVQQGDWIISGSVQTVGTAAANQSVSGTVDVMQSGTWAVSVVGNPIQVASLPGTYREEASSGIASAIGQVILFKNNPTTSTLSTISWLDPLPTSTFGTVVVSNPNSSVQVVGGVSVLQQGPWIISGSVAAANYGTQITSVMNTIPSSMMVGASIYGTAPVTQAGAWTGSVMLTASTNHSVATLVNNQLQGVTSVYGIGGNMYVAGSVATTFQTASLVSGHASVNGAASVLVIPSVGAGLYYYITDFMLSNTGAATTLVTFTDTDGSVMGKSIAPTGGGAVATAISSPMRTYSTNKAVYVGAATATSTLHAWVGGYKAI